MDDDPKPTDKVSVSTKPQKNAQSKVKYSQYDESNIGKISIGFVACLSQTQPYQQANAKCNASDGLHKYTWLIYIDKSEHE